MSKISLSEIIVPIDFQEHQPKREKLDECRNFYKRTGKQDRYIVLNKNNLLVDGYCFYLIAKEFGLDEVEVRYGSFTKSSWRRIRPRCYVYAKHLGQISDKEYVWRVPNNSDWAGYDEQLTPGMTIMAKTRNGIAPVVIKRIEWSFVPPRQKMRSVTKKSSG